MAPGHKGRMQSCGCHVGLGAQTVSRNTQASPKLMFPGCTNMLWSPSLRLSAKCLPWEQPGL